MANVAALLKPRSIALVGASDKPGSIGSRILGNIERFAFAGDLHLVSRTREEIGGRACVRAIDDLPLGVDVALLAVPRDGVAEAVEACVRRKVKSAVVYASGFSETGEEGEALQHKIVEIAARGDLALLGPNCIGLTNYRDGAPLSFGNQRPRATPAPALAIVGQSGGMVGAVRMAAEARGLSVACTIATGNEAVVRIADFLELLVDDAETSVIAIIAEEIRDARRFLKLAARASAAGKAVLLLHPGRSEEAREAARSHTGAVATDFAVMAAMVRREGVVLLETLEEVVDVAEVFLRAPANAASVAILTDSGAFKGMAADFCQKVGLELAALSPDTAAKLKARLPDFAPSGNPVDVTAQGLTDPAVYGDCAALLLEDDAVGALMIAIMPGDAATGLKVARATLPKLAGAQKPIQYVLFGEGSPVAPELAAELHAAGVSFSRSPERALRALAHAAHQARVVARLKQRRAMAAAAPSAVAKAGTLTETHSKALLSAAGFPTPEGAEASTVEEAIAIATRVGYPVALKAQAADLPHKSDVGGVVLNVADEAGLRQSWRTLHDSVANARPDLTLDGVLVERMGARGLEMIVSARRDPQWGVVLMAGVGGVWIEALDDVRLMPADLSEAEIVAELKNLRAAKLLDGIRGAPPADVSALSGVLLKLGDLMYADPGIDEVEINPLLVYPRGDGAVVLDALITIGSVA